MPATPARDDRARRKADKAYAKASRPWFKRKRYWAGAVLAVVVGAAAIDAVNGGSDPAPSSATPTGAAATSTTPAAPTPKNLTVTADRMLTDLRGNALNASDKYKGRHVTLTGYVSNIDASGGYINVRGSNKYELITVQAFTGDELREAVAGVSVGDKVTVTGDVTDVGEILGYTVDADSVK